MKPQRFYTRLGILSALVAAALAALSVVPVLYGAMPLAWASLVFFTGLSVAMYVAGRRAVAGPSKYAFINQVILFTIVKMFASVLIVLVYDRWQQPTDNWFLAPFFGIYLVFTVFETQFLMQVSQEKPTQP